MKKPIFKKLIIPLLISANTDSLREKPDESTLSLQGLNSCAFETNLIMIERQLINIDHFSKHVTFIKSIKGQSTLKSVKETEAIPLT